MSETVADFVLSRLREWGVKQVFGYPGDGINGMLAAWGRAGNEPKFVQARHEEMAAFEAVGYAKFSGEVGVCAATSGPGAVHLLNGLYDAKLDHVPVVAIVGQTARSAMGGSYQQEIDLLSLFKDCCHQFVEMGTVPEQFPNLIDRAIRVAHSHPQPDLHHHPLRRPGAGVCAAWTRVQDGALERRHRVGDPGRRRWPDRQGRRDPQRREKVAILVGQGARGARDEVLEVADLLGAGVAKALLGKDVLADDLPFVTGSIGLLGTRPSYEMMMDCDTVLTVGSNFPYTQFMPKLDQARGIQIDRDGSFIGMRYPYELNIVADAASALRALIPKLERKADRSWRDTIEKNVAALVGHHATSGHDRQRPAWGRQPAAVGVGAERATARPMPSSRPTRARRPTGMPAISASEGMCAGRCRAPWPPWVRGCPM